MQAVLPISPLPNVQTVELTRELAPLLQKFFETNPAYFVATTGEPAGPNDGLEEITGDIPAGMAFTKKWVVGYVDATGSLIAMANVITDLLARSIFHIGTFIIATSRHGNGEAQILYRGLEDWAIASGAAWMRLGVVRGNTRAERFWAARGYVPVRERQGIQMGKRMVTVQNMIKPLCGGVLNDYFALAPGDRPLGAGDA